MKIPLLFEARHLRYLAGRLSWRMRTTTIHLQRRLFINWLLEDGVQSIHRARMRSRGGTSHVKQQVRQEEGHSIGQRRDGTLRIDRRGECCIGGRIIVVVGLRVPTQAACA